jgi:hypothetical protein
VALVAPPQSSRSESESLRPRHGRLLFKLWPAPFTSIRASQPKTSRWHEKNVLCRQPSPDRRTARRPSRLPPQAALAARTAGLPPCLLCLEAGCAAVHPSPHPLPSPSRPLHVLRAPGLRSQDRAPELFRAWDGGTVLPAARRAAPVPSPRLQAAAGVHPPVATHGARAGRARGRRRDRRGGAAGRGFASSLRLPLPPRCNSPPFRAAAPSPPRRGPPPFRVAAPRGSPPVRAVAPLPSRRRLALWLPSPPRRGSPPLCAAVPFPSALRLPSLLRQCGFLTLREALSV